MTSKKEQWSALVRIADALFERESKAIAEIREEQGKLQRSRAHLEEMNELALKHFEGPHPSHWHDGEVLWQKWVGQNKRNMGMEHARLRALAEIHMPSLRKSFGRKEILKELQQTHSKRRTSSG